MEEYTIVVYTTVKSIVLPRQEIKLNAPAVFGINVYIYFNNKMKYMLFILFCQMSIFIKQ
ncbi:hypothetical protein CEQ21_12555 [Niallia circulans]|uniref:Uncharacterized protein n=1 Tax=Niallia circulans TaxID=1397 RepID=A0A553SHB9_NIACI|nr:hypothetical protein CEQ21_12555 [Niallia circulans]